jgi:ligand-binding sensor domain-containing protein
MEGLPVSDVLTLSFDASGTEADRVWVGTRTAGASNEISWYPVDTMNGPAGGASSSGDLDVLSSAVLADGTRLFGVAGGPLTRIGPSPGNAVDFPAVALAGSAVNAIAQAPNGDVFFAIDAGGVTRTDAALGNPTHFTAAPLDVSVFDIAVDAAGNAWAGTFGNGLVMKIGSAGTVTAFSNGIADDVVLAVAVDGDGNVWAGTRDGLSKFDVVSETFTSWKEEIPAGRRVAAVAVEGDVIWLGTDRGVARFDAAKNLWMAITRDDRAFPSNRVKAVVVDAMGAKWFGCSDIAGLASGGLVRYIGR